MHGIRNYVQHKMKAVEMITRPYCLAKTKHSYLHVGFPASVFVLLFSFLLFPSLISSLQEKSHQMSCLSNLRQLGLAFAQYSDDYDGKMPDGIRPRFVTGKARKTGLGWACQIYPFVKSKRTFLCPDDATSTKQASDVVISYALNSNIPRHPVETEWSNPVRTVILFEISGAHTPLDMYPARGRIASGQLSPVGDGTAPMLNDGLAHCTTIMATGDIGGRPSENVILERHELGANYLLGDDHAVFLRPIKISSGVDALIPVSMQTNGYVGRAAGANLTGQISSGSAGTIEATFSTK